MLKSPQLARIDNQDVLLVLTLVVTLTLVHLYILSLAGDAEARGDGAWRVTGQGPGHQPRTV